MSELFGFQAGPYGFVRVGLPPSETGPIDYLYLAALGGRGGGKSQGGALRALNYLTTYPKSLGIITAPVMPTMHDSTLPALFRVFNQANLLPDQDYEYNKTKEVITMWNGATILLRSTEHPQRLRGPDAAWFWMDEPRDSPFEAFTNLGATMRQQGYPHQGWLTTTPLDKYHWIYPLFFPKEAEADGFEPVEFEEEFHEGTYLHYSAPTGSNPHGGERLARNMARLFGRDSVMYRREVLGQIVLMEGLVYPGWDPTKFIVHQSSWPSKPIRICVGVDFGFAAPCAALVVGVDKAGRRYILDEHYQSEMSEDDLGDVLVNFKKKYNYSYIACDWADPRWMRTLKRKYHLPVVRANKKMGTVSDPSSGIGLCSQILADGISVGQRLYVDPKCKNFKREIENYTRDDPKFRTTPSEKPRKFQDHAMDAWRYAEQFIADHWHHPSSEPVSTILRTAPKSAILKIDEKLLESFQDALASIEQMEEECQQQDFQTLGTSSAPLLVPRPNTKAEILV